MNSQRRGDWVPPTTPPPPADANDSALRPAPETGPGGGGQVLAVRGVSVSLGGRHILRDVSFSVEQGQFTGLIGPNGAGKTTLLRVILGLQPTTSGQVRIGDRRPSRRHPALSYVPQKVLVDPDIPLRARDLVSLGVDGHRFGVGLPSPAQRELVEQTLTAVDAQRFADARVGTLSGGELQRVLIAHALISKPKLLLLDEPLANLDIRVEHEVVDLLARIAREQKVAVLIASHEMNPLLPVMHRIIYLAHGRAVSGTTDEVVRGDVLSRLYGQQVEVLRVQGRVLVVTGRVDTTHLSGRDEVGSNPAEGGSGRAC